MASCVEAALCTCLFVLIVILFVGVISRYVFNSAFLGEEDISVTLLLYIVFLGSGLAIGSASHPSITIITQRLEPRFRTGLRGVSRVVIGGYLLALVYFGTLVAKAGMTETSMTLGTPMSIAYASVPIGAAFGFLQLATLAARSSERVLDFALFVVGTIAVFLAIFVPDMVLHVRLTAAVWLLLPIFLLAEVPIAFAIGTFSMLLIATTRNASLTVAAQQLITGASSPAFIAIPTFMVTGALLEVTGMAHLLIDFFVSLVGRLRGGLAVADTLASAVFADISGSAVADTAALGSIMIPSMVRQGYDDDFAAAHQAASGSLGTLLPPSITAIIYSTVTSTSVVRLFRATAFPGIVLIALFCITAYVIARRRNYAAGEASGGAKVVATFVSAIPTLVAPIFILAGILGGIFTPTETGAAAAVYVMYVAFVMYRSRFTFSELVRSGIAAVQRTSVVMVIIANTFILAWALAASGLPAAVAQTIATTSHDPRIVLLVSAALIVVLAVFLEPPAILTGAVPLLLPAVTSLGVDAATFGVVTLLAACVGNQIPPIGITLLVATSIGGASMEKTARRIVPYTLATAGTLLLVILFPALTLLWGGK